MDEFGKNKENHLPCRSFGASSLAVHCYTYSSIGGAGYLSVEAIAEDFTKFGVALCRVKSFQNQPERILLEDWKIKEPRSGTQMLSTITSLELVTHYTNT